MKLYSFKTAALALAMAGIAALSASAADPTSTLVSADETFVKTASQHGLAEVQIATLALKKGAREDVKEIAQQMVTDHTAVNDELTALAKAKGVQISAVTDPSDTKTLKSLENEGTGNDFDKAFLNQLESGHKTAISLFEDASKDSKDADVKAFAGKHLPALRAHLDHIQAALKK